MMSALVIGAAIIGCAPDEGAPRRDAPAGQQTTENQTAENHASPCPFPVPLSSTTCPDACVPVYGNELSAAEGCNARRLVGCIACPNGCGGAPEGYCLKSLVDGTIFDEVASYTRAALPNPANWADCTQADVDKMNAAKCF